ncbi:MAG: hypothetical protein WC028_26715 [Candidatus Obscuribacterales bacterium]
MEFILPSILSIFLAPFFGLGCAIMAVLGLCLFRAVKKRPPFKDVWLIAIAVSVICTAAAPFVLVLGWATAIDAIKRAEREKAISTSREFWQAFSSIEKDLHDVKSEDGPVYQKLKLQLDKYLWPSTVIVGARHGNVRELSFKDLDIKSYAVRPNSSKLITSMALINCAEYDQFDNWLIGSGFDKPYICDSVFTHLYSGPNKYFAKDVLFSAKRTGKRINVDVYTDIDTKPAFDNPPPVTDFLKRNLGGQFFYLVLGDVKFHPLSEKRECTVQPIDKIHQAFLSLLTPSELKSLEAKVTDNMCVQLVSSGDSRYHKQFKNPHLKSTVPEEPSRY